MMYLVSHDQYSIYCIQYLRSHVLCWFDPKKKSVPVANCVHGVWRGELHLWCISLWNQVISWTFYKSDQKSKTKLNRVPERLFPGRCDLWGQSHQIFHILVVAGALAHLKVIDTFAKSRLNTIPLSLFELSKISPRASSEA